MRNRKATVPLFSRLLPAMVCIAGCMALLMDSCKKYEDVPGPTDPRLSRPYCNVPDAVNYNWDFPGTPDSTTCIYPSDVFRGRYLFTDSIYTSANSLVLERQLTLNILAPTRNRLVLLGFCGPADSLKLTATRYFRTTVDTTIDKGQLLCRPQDTLSGFISRTAADPQHLHFFFTVVSDTGFTYHMGTAVKQ